MIKRIVSLLLIIVVCTVTSHADVKIAVIDLKRAFGEYYKKQESDNMIKEQVQTLQRELQELRDDYTKMYEEGNKLKEAVADKTLSQTARDEKQHALETKAQDVYNQDRKIQEFQRVHTQELEDRQRRLTQGLIDDIAKVVTDLGAREKYTLIFDKSGNTISGTPMLMYSQDVKDITDDVIKMINSTKPAEGAKPSTSSNTSSTPPATAPATK